MVEHQRKEKYGFEDLCKIVRILRSPGGCPWDIEQTHKSIRNDFIEEVYEAVEGIDNDEPAILREELGDVLLQVVFHSDICTTDGQFSIDDVITDLCNKLIIRHPHVFSVDENYKNVDTPEKVLYNWNEIKKATKGQKTKKEELSGVSRALPSLFRGQKIAKKLRKSGEAYKCDDSELEAKLKAFEKSRTKADLGKLLFTICAAADNADINAEEALYGEIEEIINET
ncbi:MAG: MazG family protein [Clostridia bacterium]|nr:MazG family protein [Clostridia bacterium]